jgi:hypothetical protein
MHHFSEQTLRNVWSKYDYRQMSLPFNWDSDDRDNGYYDEYEEDEQGSSGYFKYIPVGGNFNDTPKSDEWSGDCFACWSRIPTEFMLTEMSYQNPLPAMRIPKGGVQFLRLGWDTVIRAVLPELPSFDNLRTMQFLHFGNLRRRSMMEASLHFRMARIYKECLSFGATTSMLRDRFPDAPASVLLGMTSLGQVSLQGFNGKDHPVSPNSTIDCYQSISKAASLVRNWEWAERMDGWRIDQLRNKVDTRGHFTRRYYGHNHYWFGGGKHFKARLKVNNVNDGWVNSAEYLRNWGDEDGWDIVDRIYKVLQTVYDKTVDMETTDKLRLNVSGLTNHRGFRKRIAERGTRRW